MFGATQSAKVLERASSNLLAASPLRRTLLNLLYGLSTQHRTRLALRYISMGIGLGVVHLHKSQRTGFVPIRVSA